MPHPSSIPKANAGSERIWKDLPRRGKKLRRSSLTVMVVPSRLQPSRRPNATVLSMQPNKCRCYGDAAVPAHCACRGSP